MGPFKILCASSIFFPFGFHPFSISLGGSYIHSVIYGFYSSCSSVENEFEVLLSPHCSEGALNKSSHSEDGETHSSPWPMAVTDSPPGPSVLQVGGLLH